MDRLVAGDVGFGKTEVAMRALFRACINSRQAVLLAPTSVLASQVRERKKEREREERKRGRKKNKTCEMKLR